MPAAGLGEMVGVLFLTATRGWFSRRRRAKHDITAFFCALAPVYRRLIMPRFWTCFRRFFLWARIGFIAGFCGLYQGIRTRITIRGSTFGHNWFLNGGAS